MGKLRAAVRDYFASIGQPSERHAAITLAEHALEVADELEDDVSEPVERVVVVADVDDR